VRFHGTASTKTEKEQEPKLGAASFSTLENFADTFKARELYFEQLRRLEIHR
jgi:hypothetical protein